MPEDIPDIYADQLTLNNTPYGVTLVFGVTPSVPTGPGAVPMERRVVIRLSLEHAKVLSMLLHKNLKQYELEHLGDPIRLPRNILQGMGLADTDW